MLDIPNDRFDDRNSIDGTDAYSRLADCAEDEAYDDLVVYIQDELPPGDAREELMTIASIWQSNGTTQEKYALIGDLFQAMIDRNASNKMRGM